MVINQLQQQKIRKPINSINSEYKIIKILALELKKYFPNSFLTIEFSNKNINIIWFGIKNPKEILIRQKKEQEILKKYLDDINIIWNKINNYSGV